MELPIIEIKNIKKKYIIGNIGTGTLGNDVKSWWARIRKKEDPNAPILEETRRVGNEFMALNGVTFNINRGERIGIIGGNGAGKSTLLKILSRVTAPTSGEIVLRGRVTSMLEVGTGFNPEMTGRENIYLNGAILGMTKAEIDAKLEQIIDFSEVREFIDTPVKRYSSGMYVKLAFSVSAHLDSEILIMDEVLAVGDAGFQKKCLDKMQDTAAENNRTILFVSHSMANIKTLCDRCVVLKDGKIVHDGDVDTGIEIYNPSKSTKLAIEKSFVGMNSGLEKEKCKLLSTLILDKDKPEFVAGEILKVKATIDNYSGLESLMHRWILYNEDMVVSTSFSEAMVTNGNSLIDCEVSFDTKYLSSGKYHVDWYIGNYTKNHFVNYGQQQTAILFSISSNCLLNDISWKPVYWGSVTTEKLLVKSS